MQHQNKELKLPVSRNHLPANEMFFACLRHCWSCDDANEQDPTPAESVACRKDENVLEEERV